MSLIKSKYNLIFAGFFISIIIILCTARYLDSPWHRFIAGDGIGYYAYLPAKFIHHDNELNFKWFNDVYNKHYVAGTFENPEDNFMVDYHGKRIDKYYQGLSFIWIPFFVLGHLSAKLSTYPADGFSLPYQLCMGLACLFYLFAGLIYLRKLLRNIYRNEAIAIWVPILIFYGTYLFNYTINYNTLSHVYSFSFLILFTYYAYKFFNDDSQKLKYALLCLLFFVITICIRPLNGLCILIIPAFMPKDFFKQKLNFGKWNLMHVSIILLAIVAVCYQLSLMHTQTGSFFSYTYSDEKFYFARSKFIEAFFSYNIGLFVYAPIMLLAFLGSFFIPGKRKYLLMILFLLLNFIYSSWWYWPIIKRALIDYYFIPALFIGALLNKFSLKRRTLVVFPLLLLCTIYYQFKEMQIRRGILSEYITYKEVFWRNFFRTRKAAIFWAPPSSVIQKQNYSEGFENPLLFINATNTNKWTGKSSLEIGPQNTVVKIGSFAYPKIYNTKARKKIRLSFWLMAEEGMGQVQIFIQFYDKAHKLVQEEPFYLGAEDILANKWDYLEYGTEIGNEALLNPSNVANIEFTIWNTEGKRKLWLDEAKFELMVCDESFETSK